MQCEVFKYEVTIKENHLDTFGHVNNATYLELYEQARWEFITNNDYGFNEIMTNKKGPVILNINISFKAELTNREKITIESTPKKMKNDLVMILEQRMIKEGGKVASVIELEVGLMDLRKRKLVACDDKWLRAVGFNQY